MNYQQLMTLAERARARAYAPYSRFTVGAALLCEDGTVYTGCNVENASFGATNCAERTAFFSAIADGARSFAAIAVAGGREGEESASCAPCGICRQVMAEFCSPDFEVVFKQGKEICTCRLEKLLAHAFTDTELKGE